jgi:hypothetical protein
LFSFFRFFRYLPCPPTSWCLETEPAQILRRHSAMRSRGTPQPLILECSWVLVIGYKSGSIPIVALVAPETPVIPPYLEGFKGSPPLLRWLSACLAASLTTLESLVSSDKSGVEYKKCSGQDGYFAARGIDR